MSTLFFWIVRPRSITTYQRNQAVAGGGCMWTTVSPWATCVTDFTVLTHCILAVLSRCNSDLYRWKWYLDYGPQLQINYTSVCFFGFCLTDLAVVTIGCVGSPKREPLGTIGVGFFSSRISFVLPKLKCQNTEGNWKHWCYHVKIAFWTSSLLDPQEMHCAIFMLDFGHQYLWQWDWSHCLYHWAINLHWKSALINLRTYLLLQAVIGQFLYPPSKRSETGGYTVFPFVSVCLCVCVHSVQSSTLCVPPTTHQPSSCWRICVLSEGTF